jgi:hypothetical protein
MNKKEISITIKPDGTLDIDLDGWEGKSCDGAIDELIKFVGRQKSSKKKAAWYKKTKIKQQQKWNG